MVFCFPINIFVCPQPPRAADDGRGGGHGQHPAGAARLPRPRLGHRLLLPVEGGGGHRQGEYLPGIYPHYLLRCCGQVVYVTATLPILLLATFVVRGLTLPGAMDGVRFFFLPNWHKVMEPRVWINAASQVSVQIRMVNPIAKIVYVRCLTLLVSRSAP